MGSRLNTLAACLSLIAIILFTVVFEVGTLRLDRKLKDTPYKEMVDKIYRELTILGLISFGVFLTLQSGSELNTDYLLAFEFSHIVIFFAALCFVASAVFMMFMNKRIKVSIDRAAAKTSEEVIREYNKKHTSGLFGTVTDSQVEFKLYNMYFCSIHKLPISAFDFGMYMREVLDEHVVELMEVEVSSWLIMILMLGLNIVLTQAFKITGDDASSRRLEVSIDGSEFEFEPPQVAGRFLRDFVARQLGSTTTTCGRRLGETASECTRRYLSETWFGHDVEEDEEDIRYLAEATDYSTCCCTTDAGRRLASSPSTDPCAAKTDGLEYNMCLAWLLVILTFTLHVIYRKKEIYVRKVIGCEKLDDACNYIKRIEAELVDDETKLLELHMENKKKSEDGRVSMFSHAGELIGAVKSGKGKDNLYEGDGDGAINRAKTHSHEHDPLKHDALLNSGTESVSRAMKKGASFANAIVPVLPTFNASKSPAVNQSKIDKEEPKEGGGEVRKGTTVPPKHKPAFKRRATQRDTKMAELRIKNKMQEVEKHIRHKYKKMLDLIMLFNCFYLAVFIANYGLVALEEESLPYLWFTVSLLPAFITMIICGKIVRTQGIIGAVGHINLNLIDKIINETEEIYATGKEVFREFRAKIDFLHITEEDLEDEFKRIDADHSGDISLNEFRKGLVSLGIHFHGGKNVAKKLFRICDEDKSGKISLDEFTKVVFPENHATGTLRGFNTADVTDPPE